MQYSYSSSQGPSKSIEPAILCIDTGLFKITKEITSSDNQRSQQLHGSTQPNNLPPEKLKLLRDEISIVLVKLEESNNEFERQSQPLILACKEYNTSRPTNAMRMTLNTLAPVINPIHEQHHPQPIAPVPQPIHPPPKPMVPTPIQPKPRQANIPPQPINQHTAKVQQPQPRRHEKKGTGKSSHTDRPTRTTTANKNDVWYLSEQFFAALPSREELVKIFSLCDKLPQELAANPNTEHWSNRFLKAIKNSNFPNKYLPPPGPPSQPDEVSEFWTVHNVNFQIEEMQRRNASPLHYLLNAFVEIPDPCPNQEQQKQETPLKTHVLLPRIQFDNYMAQSFEVRLNLELKSLGLDKPSHNYRPNERPFDSEIKTKRENLTSEIIPSINELKEEIFKNYDAWVADRDRRTKNIDQANEMIAEYNAEQNRKKNKK